MNKSYKIIEQSDSRIKLCHLKTGDIQYRYPATCPSCGASRGWKKLHSLNSRCKSCSQQERFNDTIIKTDYPNVDFNDSIKCEKPNRSPKQRYRMTCLSCASDRGYLSLRRSKRPCISCSKKQMHQSRTENEKLEIAKKISMTQTGQTVFSGFTTKELDKQRGIFKSLGLSNSCFERDDYTCNKCSERGVTLHAHHMNSFSDFPDERFELYNLVTLCDSCHGEFHKIFGRGINTKAQYSLFKNN